MKFFIDTANIEEIKQANLLGVIDGVTTNPSLVAKEGVDFRERIHLICKEVYGPVSAEVIATNSEGMAKEGRALSGISPNVVIKLPMTTEGLKAVKILSEEGIATNVTLIFTANQALLAARAGATFVSPFVGRLDDIGHNGIDVIQDIADIFAKHQMDAQIIAASIRHPEHVRQAALAGAHIATVPLKVIEQMSEHPLTDKGIEQFLSDWENAKK